VREVASGERTALHNKALSTADGAKACRPLSLSDATDRLLPRRTGAVTRKAEANRDRGEPRGSSPPTPPCVRVAYTAVRSFSRARKPGRGV